MKLHPLEGKVGLAASLQDDIARPVHQSDVQVQDI